MAWTFRHPEPTWNRASFVNPPPKPRLTWLAAEWGNSAEQLSANGSHEKPHGVHSAFGCPFTLRGSLSSFHFFLFPSFVSFLSVH
jgi:hypothetical protein